MPAQPSPSRAVAFIDGQNLFYQARAAFGYTYPNYDVTKPSARVGTAKSWQLGGVRFYTGVPDASDRPKWNHFWASKLASMGRYGTTVYSRPLRYRNKTFRLPDGGTHSVLVGEEKGIDVRIALDIISLAYRGEYDVALVFSQDQDLSEVAAGIRVIAAQQNRWIKMACAFPASVTTPNTRGINGADWIRIERADYDECIDPTDYRK